MAEQTTFYCLRCGHEYRDDWNKDEVKERTCPSCRSNSVRRKPEPAKASSGREEEG